MRRRAVTGLAIYALALGTIGIVRATNAGAQEAPTEILVGYRADAPPRAVAALESALGVTKVGEVPALDVRVVRPGSGRSTAATITGFQGNPLVAYAEPNLQYQATSTPNDPSYSKEWALTKMQAPSAWDSTTGSPGVVVAVVDTGIDTGHPDLTGKVVANVNFTTSATTSDVYGHGTHVAGIAAAATNNATGIAGVGYQSTVQNVKVLGDDGVGSTSWIANGITWAANNGAQVINLSLGGATPTSTMENAINYAWSKGVVVVAAAGNSASSTPSYPAGFANVVAVAASNSYDQLASFSNYGDWVDVTAPGVNIYSTLPGATYGYRNGTSMASPQVAGLAALVRSVARDTNGNGQVNDEIRACIQSNADPLPIVGTGSGRINALGAVNCAAGSAPAPAPATGTVAGTVADAATGTPVAGAAVAAGGLNTTTDGNGGYAIGGLAAGSYTVGVTKSGYAPASQSAGVTAGQTTTANVAIQALDTTAPTVGITSPAAGATVSGTTSVAVSASDAVGVTRVDLYVDGTLAGSSTSAPFTVAWNTTSVTDGSHTLVAKAADAAGNTGTSTSVAVTVTNAAPVTTVTNTFTGNLGGRNQPTSTVHSFTVVTTGPMSATLSYNKKASLSFSVSSSAGTVLTTGITTSPGKANATIASLPAGTYKVTVSVLTGSSSYTVAVTHT